VTVPKEHITKNKEGRTHNIGLAIWLLTCFYKTFVLNSTLGILMNFSVKNPPHRQAERRYVQFIEMLIQYNKI